MNPRVIKVNPSEDFKLELTFSNDEMRVFDVKPYLKTGRFTELKSETMFASVVCAMGSIQWQNGLDLCPDTLYEESVPFIKDKRQKTKGARHPPSPGLRRTKKGERQK